MDCEKITGAEALMRSLVAEGVKTVFGYPGGAIMPVFDALYDYTRGEGRKFNHVLVRHEQGAAHAAEGYARACGEVGVCIVTSGPGATNTLTGIADAMVDSTPIVVIAGQVGVGALGTDAFQEVDLVGVAGPISKWAYQIRRPEDVAWAVGRAFHIARTGRPGPVVLDFPKNAQTHTCEWKRPEVGRIAGYTPYPALDGGAVAAAAQLINHSKRPLAVVGQGVEIAGAHKELAEFLEKADIPVGCTLMGLSDIPTGHRLNMGMLGMHGNYAPNIKTQECDVLIAIGMRFSDRVTGLPTQYAKQAKVVHLDIDPAEINKNIRADVAVVGDCKASLPAITRLLEKNDHSAWISSFEPYAEEEAAKVSIPATKPLEGPLLMGEVVSAVAEIVEETAGKDGVLVNDVGQNQMFSSRYFRYLRERSIITSGGLGTMGFGLPAAVGAAFAAPGRTICLFTGDGGLQMSIHELGTIMEQQAPVKIILLNNNYLGNVRQWQEMFFQNRVSYTRMANPSYEDICRAYRIQYGLAVERKELEGRIREMLSTPGPYLLECAVREEDNVMPMTPPGKAVHEMMLQYCGE